ncbi:uncharacterized protein LOC117616847 [Prunus dulcis]|uniref:uncharacterized protein LOC117616847 n=1 Tax=Prunus dulcis TaxID=3755 RepID=UPI00148279BC|nr:uncharacterized protein LOC117616847 [Prunus dulcis]
MGLIDLQLALRVKPRYGMSFKGRSNKIGILCKLLVPLTTFGTSVDGNGGECFNTTKCFPKLINLLWQSSLFHSGCSLFSIVMSRSRRKSEAEPVVELAKDAFYVVRKGDIVGVYKSFGNCQAQLSSSIFDPPVSVYKGYSLPEDTEEYSCGLTNAIYTIAAADLKDDIFGKLMHCPFQDPGSLQGEASVMDALKKRSHEVPASDNFDDPLRKHVKIDHSTQSLPLDSGFCTLEFDGASKGNPGLAGAGAVLRADDGSLICKLHEGLGVRTNNVAEYRALILGLKYALKKGFTKIRVKGDSKLVCMQVQGLWKVRNQNMSDLCEEVKELKDKFLSFEISHVLRELNSEADAQANLAVRLTDGQVQEEEFGK